MAKKTQLGYREIEERLTEAFVESYTPADEVGYELLYSFGKSERDIERYKEGKGILKTFDGLLIKGLFGFRDSATFRLTETLEQLKRDIQVQKAAPKIVAVSDGQRLLAYDLREKETYENPLNRLPCDFAFFYPLMDVERVRYVEESPADIKAAEKLAKLHDELRAYNDFRSDSDLHDLNIFITRLLFCFFAEDTGIFEEGLFTSSIRRYTKEDGSDLSDYLDESFNVMDRSQRNSDIPKIVTQFPYVNGGLFAKQIQIPRMGARARKLIIECGELDWKDINPDIFGSMIQAVVNPEERANQGMHYTSVPNIMKVINPLFLDELRDAYNQLKTRYDHAKQLWELRGIPKEKLFKEYRSIVKEGDALLQRMSRMKFFDPACGSGNFLIITYKSLRFLEMDILKLQQICQGQSGVLLVDNSVIRLDQFYGIELLDFPHEVAMLSLWLAEHQMNTKLNEAFGVNTHALPLKNITQIVCGNACRLDWNEVCPHTAEEEVFVFGNPPYLGGKLQSKSQKADVISVLGHLPSFKNLDYISIWFYKAAEYINDYSKYAFVSTNSIVQGEQVAMIWPYILEKETEIIFAYKPFKWSNNAKHNAGVTCVIIGVATIRYNGDKYIFDTVRTKNVNNITPYLCEGNNVIVHSSNTSISDLPLMEYGNMPLEGGFLKLSEEEKRLILEEYPKAEKFIKPTIGGEELINSIPRYCIWIDDEDKNEALSIPPLRERINGVYNFRINGGDVARSLANRPHQFRYRKLAKDNEIIIACTSSERRDYLQCGYYNASYITMNSIEVIYDGGLWIFGITSTKLHMIWTKAIGGYLGTSIRYSTQLCYNTFPFPSISEAKKQEIAEAAEEVLITREFHIGKTLAELYDPDQMPQDLREAHERLDDIVESCYPGYPFANDEARLECLFKLYEQMTTAK
ncbi:MAG: N-6 DNA methylase [bacterium]|nr:N-6 DNA methylase [bacterium]